MGRIYCCVVNCKNTSANSEYKFYKFPTVQWRLYQRQKWIAAVNRINPDGSPWNPNSNVKICSSHFVGNAKSENHLSPSYVPTIFPDVYKKRKVDDLASKNSPDGSPWQPKKNTRICSRHFVGNKKSEHPLSPSYIPTIFPEVYGKNKRPETCEQASERFRRTLKRQTTKTCVKSTIKLQTAIAGANEDVSGNENDLIAAQRDQMTQVDFLEEQNNCKMFICNRFDYGVTCDAEIQTAIPLIKCDVFKMKKVIAKKIYRPNTVPVYPVGSKNHTVSLIKSSSKFHGYRSAKSRPKIIVVTSRFSSDIENNKMDVQEDPLRIKCEEAEFVLPDTIINHKETIGFKNNHCEKIKSEPIDAVTKCEETEISFEETKVGLTKNIINSDKIKIDNVDWNNTNVNEHFSSNSSVVSMVIKCDPFIKQEIDDTTV